MSDICHFPAAVSTAARVREQQIVGTINRSAIIRYAMERAAATVETPSNR